MSEETIEIKNCPHCDGSHLYKLKVERAIIFQYLGPDALSEPPRKVKVTRLFVCPKESKQYQGTFSLRDTSSDRIENVEVIGLL